VSPKRTITKHMSLRRWMTTGRPWGKRRTENQRDNVHSEGKEKVGEVNAGQTSTGVREPSAPSTGKTSTQHREASGRGEGKGDKQKEGWG